MSNQNPSMQFLERNMLQIAVIAVGGYVLWKMFGQKASAETQQAAAIGTDLAILENKGVSRSYTDTEYKSFADRLYKAMFDTGTDEKAIFAVAERMLNDADVYATIRAFGSRRASLGDAASFLTWWTLPEWIDNELDDEDVEKLNQILAINKVRYRF